MHKTLAAAALCGTLAFGPAHAAKLDPHQMLPSFTLDNVATAANAIGYQSEMLNNGDGQKAVGITAPDGVKFLVQPSACQQGDQQCFGLNVFALFKGKVPGDVLSAFNAKHVFTSAFSLNSATALVRYEIADYGIPIGNVASNLGNFDAVVKLFVQFVQSSGQGASLTPAPQAHPTMPSFGGTPISPASEEPLYQLTPQQQKYVNSIAP